MGSYSVAQYGRGGVEVANMSPAFSAAKPMYIMQEPTKGQVFVQAVPAANQTLRSQAQPVTVYNPTVRPVLSQQPQQVTLVHQVPSTAGTVRLVQVPGNSVQLQLQHPQQLVVAPKPNQVQSQQGDVVYVTVNGVLQQGVLQNGSVYLLGDGTMGSRGGLSQAQQVQVQPAPTQHTMAMAVNPRQATVPNGQIIQLSAAQAIQQPQQQYVAQQQQAMLPAGARLVPMSQAPVQASVAPPQQLVMQPQAHPVMTLTVPAGMNAAAVAQQQQPVMLMTQQRPPGAVVQSSNPMTMMVVSGPKPTGVPANAAGLQQPQMQQVQQVAMRTPTSMSATARGPAGSVSQSMQAVHATPTVNSFSVLGQQGRQVAGAANTRLSGNVSTVSNTATGCQQASMQAFKPALAAGAKILVSGTSVSASTASLVSKAVPAPVSAENGALSAGFSAPEMQLVVPSHNSIAGTSTQPMMLPAGNGMQQSVSRSAAGELPSPPAPPLTPAGVANSSPGAASNLSAMLNIPSSSVGPAPNTTVSSTSQLCGSQSPLHGVIGGHRKSKDGLGMLRAATPTAAMLVGASPTSSAPGSQPGTPARSNSGGALVAEASNASSLPGPEGTAGASNKEAVIRLMARSFIETGIALEQALTMIQPADRDLLMAAFAAEASGAPQPAVATSGKATAGELCTVASNTMAGVSSNGLAALGGTEIAMPSKGPISGEGLSLGLSGLTGLSFAEDVSTTNDSNINMGSWGFSLFSSNAITGLNGSIAGARLLGSVEAALPDVAAAPTMQSSTAAAAAAANKDSAMAGMLASLNL